MMPIRLSFFQVVANSILLLNVYNKENSYRLRIVKIIEKCICRNLDMIKRMDFDKCKCIWQEFCTNLKLDYEDTTFGSRLAQFPRFILFNGVNGEYVKTEDFI